MKTRLDVVRCVIAEVACDQIVNGVEDVVGTFKLVFCVEAAVMLVGGLACEPKRSRHGQEEDKQGVDPVVPKGQTQQRQDHRCHTQEDRELFLVLETYTKRPWIGC